ncbi:leukocyte elastase inhibitor-like isoform X1 [Salarias fasciatus]|uniref:leukocyte elastase inhibitor-like isoform X1 n=1 Tax=Salarias fasciatus TaxID=181472 RepID=UPI0011770780|nr:leukocyte elastase inhibitor-like isoform X1 [Salarias fasciatus]
MASAAPLTKTNAGFVLDMLKKLRGEDKKENVLFCPVSLSAGLAMVLMGAKGNTAKQISEVLQLTETQPKSLSATPLQSLLKTRTEARTQVHTQIKMQIQQRSMVPSYLSKVLKSKTDNDAEQTDKGDEETPKGGPETGKDEAQNGSDAAQTSQGDAQAAGEVSQTEKDEAPAAQDDVHAKLSELLSPFFKDDAPFGLSVANRLYGEKSCEFIEGFSEETKKLYNAELEPVDFKGNAETERVNINSWVEKQTQGKVKDLLAQGVVSDMTRLVLVNAIYFKGKWAEQFKEEYTVDDRFRINKTETKPVKMMRQKKKFHINTLPEVNSQIIELPYVGEDLSMFIILPNDIEDETTGLKKLEQELTFDKFEEWSNLDAMGKNEVELSLPRFKLEESYSLKEVLSSMGMVDAFDVSKSNFSGMSPANDLVLSSVVHKAFVEVNEVGTEAAAATAAVVGTRSVVIPDRFVADHPFLFFIQHKPTKTVLFAGRYSSPE